MRPLIAADPMFRAPRPEMVSESKRTGPAAATGRGGWGSAAALPAAGAGAEGACFVPGAGCAKRLSAIGTLISIASIVTFVLFWLPFAFDSNERGRYQPPA